MFSGPLIDQSSVQQIQNTNTTNCQQYKHKNTHTKIQIPTQKRKYKNTITKIQIQKKKYKKTIQNTKFKNKWWGKKFFSGLLIDQSSVRGAGKAKLGQLHLQNQYQQMITSKSAKQNQQMININIKFNISK